MSEKTYPDAEGYDPTIGMSDEIQRFEYIVWFKGDYIKPAEIAGYIHKLLEAKGVQPIQAQYGIVDVPEEDVGEGPYHSSASKVRSEK